MFKLPEWHWARTRAYMALNDYKFRHYLLEEDIDEIKSIANGLVKDFADEGLPLPVNQMDARVVKGVSIAYDVDDATGHVLWESIIPTVNIRT